MLRLLLLLVIPLLIQACAYQKQTHPTHDMMSYRDALADAIHGADTVRIIERSHPSDSKGDAAFGKPRRIYRQVDLPPAAASSLERSIRSLPAETKGKKAQTRCAFADHHAIQFHNRENTTSTLRICFQCGDVIWDGSDRPPPEDLLGTLRRFLISQGFQAERDWKKLAEAP